MIKDRNLVNMWSNVVKKLIILLSVLILIACTSTPKPPEQPLYKTPQRVTAWKNLIAEGISWETTEKLHKTNAFINEVEFLDDIEHWKQDDYWATPLETLVTNGGDCEDIALAKYFTLLAMGIPEKSMRITYVKAIGLDQPHMVVSYYQNIKDEPLVLDNLNHLILKASLRPDLIPVYNFNGSGLWITKKSHNNYLGEVTRFSLWEQVKEKMQMEQQKESEMICQYQLERFGGNAKEVCFQ